jgi:Ca2+-binding EF-hand superfamily protein
MFNRAIFIRPDSELIRESVCDITVDELKGILANNGEKISDIELNDMIKDADIDGDGKINYEGNI